MDTASAIVPGGFAQRDLRTRVLSVIAAMALVLAAFVLVQQPAEAAPGASPVAAAVAGSGASSITPQLDFFAAFVCPLLQAILAAFQGSPFFAFVEAIINSLLVAFGCDISPG